LALLRLFLLALVCLMAVPAQGHRMGRPVPIGYAGEGMASLAAQVIAVYFEEQMGREMKLVSSVSPAGCIRLILDREIPMAVVPVLAAGDPPEGIVRLKGAFGAPERSFILVMGSEAREKLEFSLVQRYVDSLTKGIDPDLWKNSEARVEAGEGVRGVAMEMLREKDLI